MSKSKTHKSWLPWAVWGLAAGFFFSQYIARVAPSVMVPDLMRTFHVDGFALGGLGAFFYYAYVPMQVPVGMLVDRFGVRRLLLGMTLLASFACYVFSTSTNIYFADLSRLFLGFC